MKKQRSTKRILSLLMAIIMIVAIVPTSVSAASSFRDVKANHSFYTFVNYGLEKGYFAVNADDPYFYPYDYTSANFVVSTLAKIDPDYSEENYTSSTPEVEWAYENNIINWKMPNIENFNPDFAMKREDVAMCLYNYALHREHDTTFNQYILYPFVDYFDYRISDPSTWPPTFDGMSWAFDKGVLKPLGTNPQTISPFDTVYNFQFAEILYNSRHVIKIEENEEPEVKYIYDYPVDEITAEIFQSAFKMDTFRSKIHIRGEGLDLLVFEPESEINTERLKLTLKELGSERIESFLREMRDGFIEEYELRTELPVIISYEIRHLNVCMLAQGYEGSPIGTWVYYDYIEYL